MPKCAYIERDKRCRRNGTGNPPLCEAHRLVIESAASRSSQPGEVARDMFRRAARGEDLGIGDVIAGLEDFFDMFKRPPGDPLHARASDYLRQAQDHLRRPPPPRQKAPPKPPPRVPRQPAPDPKIAARREARKVLGFSPDQKLTEHEIKHRQRDLARKHHPDLGGNVDVMRRINCAVDVLLDRVISQHA